MILIYKYLIFTVSVLFSLFENSLSQNYWSVISSPVSKPLTNCCFINSNTGWISGDSGTIISTTSGGNNWTVQNSGTFNNIEDIFFLNERLGWAVAYEIFPDTNSFPGTRILQTTNGGDIWTNFMYPDTNMFFKTVCYIDSLRGFLGGIGATILLTTNGGNSWSDTDTDTTLIFVLPVFKIRFFDFNLGYACGGFRDIAGLTWVTTNGGLNWKGTTLAPEPFFDIAIMNSQKTICAGGDLEYGSSIARTVNQGVNWFYDTLGVFGLATGISNRTQSEIWMVSGNAEKFLYSLDSGYVWTAIETPYDLAIFDVEFTDTTYGYACGENGSILKYDRSMSFASNNNSGTSEPDFILNQNYPNPFNPSTIISYELRVTNYVSLRIFDISGKNIATLVNEKQNAGNHEIEFNAGNLPSGIYFYKLTSGKYSVSRKMVLTK